MYRQDGARCMAVCRKNQVRTATAYGEFVGTVKSTSRRSRPGSRLLETGALPGQSSSSSLPCQTHAAMGGIEMVVLGMVSLCSRLGAGGGVADQSTTPR